MGSYRQFTKVTPNFPNIWFYYGVLGSFFFFLLIKPVNSIICHCALNSAISVSNKKKLKKEALYIIICDVSRILIALRL